MTQTTEIGCPKCGSTQLTANKKGFSGTKAVGGVILTGGIGLLAGTIGRNNVLITCLACGKRFKPGEGKKISVNNQLTYATTERINSSATSAVVKKRIVCSGCQTENFSNHKYCKNCKKELNDQDNRIDSTGVIPLLVCQKCRKRAPKDGKYCPHCGLTIEPPKSGCFIATACYGDYNAPEVLILRQYRDDKLLKSFFGKYFVKLYYLISPYIASLIAKSERLKKSVRHYFLAPIVSKLMQKSNNYRR
jgi:RNA polymerase subunit RPABC4/transcription elongation factor Spt4